MIDKSQRIANLSHEECECIKTAAIVGVPHLADQLLRLGLSDDDEHALRMATHLRLTIMVHREAKTRVEERRRRDDDAA